MTKENLAQYIRCGIFADRQSLSKALEYALDVMKDNPAAITAMYVVLNTLSKEILNIENEETV